MDFSKVSASDKRMLIAAVGVVIGGLVSIIDRWGIGGIIGGFAGLGAILVILQPQLSPAMKLPAPKATLLLGLGAVAAGGFILSALQYIGFLFDPRIYTILFDVGLVAALVLAYFAWLGYKAAAGTASGASAAAPAVAPPASAPPAPASMDVPPAAPAAVPSSPPPGEPPAAG
jgi:hypothetical protein